jgi:hypothetical protein
LTSSAESADSVSGSSEPGCEPSPSAKSTPTAKPCSESTGRMCPASAMCVTCTPTMSGQLTLFAEGSHAKTSALPAEAQGSTGPAPAYGANIADLSKSAGRRGSSSKMSAPFDLADWIGCSGKSLRSGSMRNGTVYPLPPLVPLMRGTASGLWPTPTVVTGTGGVGFSKWGGSRSRAKLRRMVSPKEFNGALNPMWVEWLMGFPLDWSALPPSGMPWSRKSRKSSAKPSCRPSRADEICRRCGYPLDSAGHMNGCAE